MRHMSLPAMELARSFRNTGRLDLYRDNYTVAEFNEVIDWYELLFDHADLPPVYDAIVAARNAQELTHA